MDLIIENKNVKLGKNHIFLEGTFGILKKTLNATQSVWLSTTPYNR